LRWILQGFAREARFRDGEDAAALRRFLLDAPRFVGRAAQGEHGLGRAFDHDSARESGPAPHVTHGQESIAERIVALQRPRATNEDSSGTRGFDDGLVHRIVGVDLGGERGDVDH
jgi:hypothetical protein